MWWSFPSDKIHSNTGNRLFHWERPQSSVNEQVPRGRIPPQDPEMQHGQQKFFPSGNSSDKWAGVQGCKMIFTWFSTEKGGSYEECFLLSPTTYISPPSKDQPLQRLLRPRGWGWPRGREWFSRWTNLVLVNLALSKMGSWGHRFISSKRALCLGWISFQAEPGSWSIFCPDMANIVERACLMGERPSGTPSLLVPIAFASSCKAGLFPAARADYILRLQLFFSDFL